MPAIDRSLSNCRYDVADADHGGTVGKGEFVSLVEYMVLINNIWHEFELKDVKDGDVPIPESEWCDACRTLTENGTLDVTHHQAGDSYDQAKIANGDRGVVGGTGEVIFHDFCTWSVKNNAAMHTRQKATSKIQVGYRELKMRRDKLQEGQFSMEES